MIKTGPRTTKALNDVMNNEFFHNLAFRWWDEKDYEDIEGYAKAFNGNTVFCVIKFCKRRFGFAIEHPCTPSAEYKLNIKSNGEVSWQRLT